MKMFPHARRMTLKKMWPFWSKSTWAPWAPWLPKEVKSRAKLLEEESATTVIVQSILLRIVPMKEEKSEKLTFKKKRFNRFAKRRGDKAFVHEDYLSEDEEDG